MREALRHAFDTPLFLLGIPALWALAGWLRARRRKGRLPGALLLPGASRLRQLPRGLASRLAPLPLRLRLVALTLALVALARPVRWDPERLEVEGLDIVVALDLSGSMQCADVTEAELRAIQARGGEPQSRFQAAVAVLKDFIRSRRYDRIGLVVFGRDAYAHFPLTLDYSTTLGIIDRLALGDIDGTATAIGNALARALGLLRESEARTRLVILITDGDNNSGNITPTEAARIAARMKVKVFPILVGTRDLAIEPVGPDFFNKRLLYRKADYPANPELLQEIARTTGGEFYRATDRKALEEDFTRILATYEKTRMKDLISTARMELFPYFLWAAVLLLAAEAGLRMTVLRKMP